MTQYKVGDEISDEDGWRSIEEISDDGTIITSDEDGEERREYNESNDKRSRKYHIQAQNKDYARIIFNKRFPNQQIKDIKVIKPATLNVVGAYMIYYKPKLTPTQKDYIEDIGVEEYFDSKEPDIEPDY